MAPAYIVVKTGVLRCLATSASSIQVDDGAAITLVANEALLISCGKARSAKIAAATDAATMVVTAEGYSGGGRHTFSVGDYIQTVDGGDTDGFTSDFETAASAGKQVTAVTASTITTNYDSSAASADYALSAADATAGTVPLIKEQSNSQQEVQTLSLRQSRLSEDNSCPPSQKNNKDSSGWLERKPKVKRRNSSPEVARVAATASTTDVKKFASTKHKGLPEKKKMNEEGYTTI